MAVGGRNSVNIAPSQDVYIFLDNKWVSLTQTDPPVARGEWGMPGLLSNNIIVVGGFYDHQFLDDVYIGTLYQPYMRP